MFGKALALGMQINYQLQGMIGEFQSPCAGNMFGKTRDTLTLTVHPFAFQSPCAGNMFGKLMELALTIWASFPEVSIPVCGEHVW